MGLIKMKMGKKAKDSTDAQIRKKKNIRKKPEGLIGPSSQWRSSVDDPFSALVGSTEGGFLSLEEIDEDLFNLGQKDSAQFEKTGSPSRKRKRGTKNVDDRSESVVSQRDDSMQGLASNPTEKKKKKKNNKKKKNKKKKTDTIDSKSEMVHLSGFLSLEETDEDLYNLGQKESAQFEKIGSPPRKRKCVTKKVDDRSESVVSQRDELMQGLASKPTKKKKKKKNKKKKTDTIESKSEMVHLSEEDRDADNANIGISGVPGDISAKDCEGDLSFGEEEFSAWNELRLHPLLKRAICALQFKEPMPIQKLCIPAAAHQGKDVIGAAETGSGKTLAFGLPILQRLLEEQEKAARKEGLPINGQTFTGEDKGAPLRALIVTPTRELALQVCDHLRAAAKFTNIRVVPIVGGLAPQKQERLLKKRPHIIVGTPGRLWALMAGGERHLVELQSLSFFVLDEADRMIEKGHFNELQSIIDMLPHVSDHSVEPQSVGGTQPLENVSIDELGRSSKRKRRQTFVFSATIALTSDFRKKLSKGGLHKIKLGSVDENDSLAALSERAGVRQNAAVVDLTSSSIMAHNLEESVIECREEDKDMYLYYILKVHGCGRTIVFCTSIAALRRISALLRILKVTAWPLHAQMQQRARLKAMDHFKENDNCVLVATDVAARGLDIPGVRTVIHYQLPHSAEVYVHRSGRTARAASDGCSIALIAPTERSKYIALCRSFSKDGLQEFPVNSLYMPEVEKRLSIARQIDRILRKNSQSKAQNNWYIRNAEALEIEIENNETDNEEPRTSKSTKAELFKAKQLQKEMDQLLTCPLQPKSLSRRFVTGAGMSTLLQQQLQELTSNKAPFNNKMSNGRKKHRLLVIGEEAIEPLMALRNSKNIV